MDDRQKLVDHYNNLYIAHSNYEKQTSLLRSTITRKRAELSDLESRISDFSYVGRTVGDVLMPISTSSSSYGSSPTPDSFIIRNSHGNRYLVTRKEELELLSSKTFLEASSYSNHSPSSPSSPSPSSNDKNNKNENNKEEEVKKVKKEEIQKIILPSFSNSNSTSALNSFTENSSNKNQLPANSRIALDVSSLIITSSLPPALSPQIYSMSAATSSSGSDPISFSSIGGLSSQLAAIREVVELPLLNPAIFSKVGVTPPKGLLLYGPPGTGKTLLARAIASSVSAAFIKVSASQLMQKYIGESAKMVRELFEHAKKSAPCVVFIDEIDAIGGRRQADASSADKEVQRTLIELLNCLDGFDSLGNVRILMATNRPDTLDSALLRPGRLDRKIEIPLPGEEGRKDIFSIYLEKIERKVKDEEKMIEEVGKLSEGFNGADIKNVCTEAAYCAIREDRDWCEEVDFMMSVRKIGDAKKLEKRIVYAKA